MTTAVPFLNSGEGLKTVWLGLKDYDWDWEMPS
jgi:hypothetical protein